MEALEAILFAIGVILALVGSIMILVHAFKESVAWGLCALFIPFVLLIFAFMHWDQCKKGFGIWIAGVCFYLGSIFFFGEEIDKGNIQMPQ